MQKYDLSPLIGFALFIVLGLLSLGLSDRWFVTGFSILTDIPLALVMFGCAGALYLASFSPYSGAGNIPMRAYRLRWLRRGMILIACLFVLIQLTFFIKGMGAEGADDSVKILVLATIGTLLPLVYGALGAVGFYLMEKRLALSDSSAPIVTDNSDEGGILRPILGLTIFVVLIAGYVVYMSEMTGTSPSVFFELAVLYLFGATLVAGSLIYGWQTAYRVWSAIFWGKHWQVDEVQNVLDSARGYKRIIILFSLAAVTFNLLFDIMQLSRRDIYGWGVGIVLFWGLLLIMYLYAVEAQLLQWLRVDADMPMDEDQGLLGKFILPAMLVVAADIILLFISMFMPWPS